MALNDGPYYTTSSQVVEELQTHESHTDEESIYPDLGPSTTDHAQMYALADNALQAHQGNTASHFAGLIQAATVAAGQERISSRPLHDRNQSRHITKKSYSSKHDGRNPEVQSREQPQHTRSETASWQSSTRKRQRTSDGFLEGDDEENLTLGAQAPGPSDQAPVCNSTSPFFRRPSSTNKKYTRPPMSKLFTSLELSPECFLQLQSAAKNYMLNDAFPDRRETVGQRGRGDSELVKLRLWNCVKDFLEGEGNGQRFFGPDAAGDEGVMRTMFWPTHKNNIVTAVTPLLRRMVTNERQRQYAVETRKPGSTNDNHINKKINLTVETLHPLLAPGIHTHHPSGLNYEATDLQHFFHEINGSSLEEYNACEFLKNPQLKSSFDAICVESGLPVHDLNGVIATIDYHLRMFHGTGMQDFSACTLECEKTVINQMLSTGYIEVLSRRAKFQQNVGGNDSFAVAVLQVLFKVLKGQLSIDKFANHPVSVSAKSSDTFVPNIGPTQPDWPLDPDEGFSNGRPPLQALVLQLYFLKNGKRILPRLDLFADQYRDFSLILQRAAGDHCGVVLAPFKVKVLIPEGLKEINEDVDWKTAIEISRSLDWMEGKVKVLVEV